MIKVLIIGYGSLMSHFGSNEQIFTKNIEIFNPFIARFKGSRGFNTTEDFNLTGDNLIKSDPNMSSDRIKGD